jgi:hypothetical protein
MKITVNRGKKTLQTVKGKVLPRTTHREIERIVSRGAQSLFDQFHSSDGYTSFGDSELAEAAIVVHVASAFIREKHVVWPESPFKTKKRRISKAKKKSKRRVANHLDLLIHLRPELYSAPSIITFEAKAIAPGSVSGKLREVLKDYKRICRWKSLSTDGRPLHFSHSKPETIRGLLTILLTEEIDVKTKDVPSNFLSRWWGRPSGPIAGAKSALTKRVKSMLSASILHDVVESPYKDGGLKRSVAYAIFPCPAF